MPTNTNIGVSTTGIIVTLVAAGAILGVAIGRSDILQPFIQNGLANATDSLAPGVESLAEGNINIPPIVGDLDATAQINQQSVPVTGFVTTRVFSEPLYELYPAIRQLTVVVMTAISLLRTPLEEIAKDIIIVFGALLALITLVAGGNFTYSGFIHGLLRELRHDHHQLEEDKRSLQQQVNGLLYRVAFLEQHLHTKAPEPLIEEVVEDQPRSVSNRVA